MGDANQIAEVEAGIESLDVNDLVELYDGTVDELRRCAHITPERNLNDPEGDLREAALLNFEAQVLDQAASIKLCSKNDILHLMDIWVKTANIQPGEQASPSDRIVMNIFRHVSNAQLTIE